MPSLPSDPVVASIRGFSRFYTRWVGVLKPRLLDSDFSLTEVRVLYELAHAAGLTATDLGRELGLDPGYLSRILARFQKLGLLDRQRARHDRRQSILKLSAKGRTIFGRLDRASSRQISGLIDPLSVVEREGLTDTMRRVEHLLKERPKQAREVTIREPQSGDLGWVVQRHGVIYAREYGWDTTFEALVARIVADFRQNQQRDRERCWIAEMDGVPVGCIFLVRESDTVAKLRLLLVEPSARGAGVGRKLIEECLRFARSAGYAKVTLWTNSVLHAARHLYEQAGFRLVKTEPHHSFGHALEGQYWERILDEA